MREKKILRYLLIAGVISLPFLFKKQPVKDWIIVFCLKAFYSGFVDSIVVAQKKIIYPVRLLPKIFNINILFDLILFPIACVIYNRITYNSNVIKTIYNVFFISIPIIIGEIWIEKNTQLIKYKKNWNWFYSFIGLNLSFWLVRGTMAVIRKLDKTTKEWAEAENIK
jgi:hypothetical protein